MYVNVLIMFVLYVSTQPHSDSDPLNTRCRKYISTHCIQNYRDTKTERTPAERNHCNTLRYILW